MSIKNSLFLLPFICFATGYFISSLIVQQPYIVTPSLVGVSVAQACVIASRHEVTIKLLGDKEDNDVPAGTVLRQTPQAGNLIKPHQSIHVLISKQQALPRAPHIIGMHQKALLSIDNSSPIKIYAVPCIHPTGICFAQTPLPDELITNNNLIAYISVGTAKPIIWPCLTGQLVQDVLALLETHAITIDLIHTYPVPHYHRCHDCRVIHQNPRPGSLLILDSRKPMTIQLQVE
jgi:hypothetical protein